MALTDRQIKSAKPRDRDYKLSDDRGLYVLVTKSGSKLFKWKYRIEGKEKKLSLGTYPEVSLAKARLSRDEARIQLSQGIDPSASKKAQKRDQAVDAEDSLRSVAEEWLEVRMSDRSESYQAKVRRSLEVNVYPKIGVRSVAELTTPDLLVVIRDIENRGVIETAHRVKQTLGQIFRYAIATGRAISDPIPALSGALKPRKQSHYASITNPEEVGKLMRNIDAFNGTPTVRYALKLGALFFCRPGELRHLQWSDINQAENRIEIVAEKTDAQHIIPISRQARVLLDELYEINHRSKYLFPSSRGASRCMSDNAMRTALRSMGYTNGEMTPHGFRAMARTLLDEVLDFRVEWIEQQLAHAVRDPNGRAYNRTKHLQQRAEMMQAWADYLEKLKNSSPN